MQGRPHGIHVLWGIATISKALKPIGTTMPLHANGTYTITKDQQERLGRFLAARKPPTLHRQIAANGLLKGLWRYLTIR